MPTSGAEPPGADEEPPGADEEPPGGPFYLHRDHYWVPADQADQFPVRQGDLFGAMQIGEEQWDGAVIVHPTCELPKASVKQVQIARVRPLDKLPDLKQRTAVQAGFTFKDGNATVAFAHTFFLAPPPGGEEPLYTDLRDIALAPRETFTADQRAAALTHDARVTFIRRYLYFRFRLPLSFEQVRAMEAARIAADPHFTGPRPDWAA